jgi:hypothetical protein
MPRCTNSCCFVPLRSSPLKRIDPLEGVSTPDSTLKNVLLPAPLGPMMEVTRPGRNSVVTPCSATKPPNLTPISLTARSGAFIA